MIKPHFHRWETGAVYLMETTHFNQKTGARLPVTSPFTEALQHCGCGKFRTKTFKGHWKLEDFNYERVS